MLRVRTVPPGSAADFARAVRLGKT